MRSDGEEPEEATDMCASESDSVSKRELRDKIVLESAALRLHRIFQKRGDFTDVAPEVQVGMRFRRNRRSEANPVVLNIDSCSIGNNWLELLSRAEKRNITIFAVSATWLFDAGHIPREDVPVLS